MTNKEIGKYGENLAKEYLIKQGFSIIATNFHYSKIAEIDIIAKKDNVIHFVEVKTRTSDFFGAPIEAIGKKKLESIYHASLFYIQQNKIFSKFQIDAIGIILDKDKNPTFNFIENINI